MGRDDPHPAGIDAEEIINARLVARAALDDLSSASFPMTPSTIRSVTVASGHHYKQAILTCRKAGDRGGYLVDAPPQQLVGIEPDDIDAAVAMASELDITVEEVDAAALARSSTGPGEIRQRLHAKRLEAIERALNHDDKGKK